LANDHHVTFLQTAALGYFGRRTIGKTDLDSARLWFVVRTHDPDNSGLSFQNRRTRLSKLAIATLLSAIRIRRVRRSTAV
jgi:hypothetical protein